MDPTNLPVVTQQDVDKSFNEKLKATATAVGFTSFITSVNYLFNAPGPKSVQTLIKVGVTGVEATKTETGRASIRVPAVTLLAGLLPQPVGYVPAEAYNLHPEVYKQALGFPVGQKPPLFSASDVRIKVYEAEQAAGAIGARALQVKRFNFAPTFLDRQMIPPGPIDVTHSELQYLKQLPPGFSAAQELIPQLEARASDLRPEPVQPPVLPAVPVAQSITADERAALQRFLNAVGVTPAWAAAEDFQSVNQKALDNQNNDQGGRLMLVADRVDP